MSRNRIPTQRVNDAVVAVIIPCFRVRHHILDVLSRIDSDVAHIYVVDDCCPDFSGEFVSANCDDPRVCVIRHDVNLGVGGAVTTGYMAALRDGATILVKVDGDGQMDPGLISQFISPILKGHADYTKGNRFYDLEHIGRMPLLRLIGNAGLSFINKLSSGYWTVFDPTNGYTAIHGRVARQIPLAKLSRRYFFETDLLFQLGTIRAVVMDVPMHAVYGDEKSHLRVSSVFFEFAFKHLRNMIKRIFYNYFLRDLSVASLSLVTGIFLLGFGFVFGVQQWYQSYNTGIPATTGTVMLAALPAILGFQLLLQFISYDVASTPVSAIHDRLPELKG